MNLGVSVARIPCIPRSHLRTSEVVAETAGLDVRIAVTLTGQADMVAGALCLEIEVHHRAELPITLRMIRSAEPDEERRLHHIRHVILTQFLVRTRAENYFHSSLFRIL